MDEALRAPPPTPDPVADEPRRTASPVASVASPRLACRRIQDADLPEALALLCAGFPERSRAYWQVALERLRARDIPEGRPRYGYVMTADDRLVGIILTIFATTDRGTTRANVSSWYVEPAYRGFSHLLLAIPLKLKDVTLFNISPTRTTIETITAQGFTPYSSSSFQALAALAPSVTGAQVRRVTPDTPDAPQLLTDHARWGCLSLEVAFKGDTHPFVFTRMAILDGRVPCAQLVYCRHMRDFRRFAGPLGRRLLRHGLPIVMVDAEVPLPGLLGSMRTGRGLRVCRGPAAPRVGDLSYTELAIFGP